MTIMTSAHLSVSLKGAGYTFTPLRCVRKSDSDVSTVRRSGRVRANLQIWYRLKWSRYHTCRGGRATAVLFCMTGSYPTLHDIIFDLVYSIDYPPRVRRSTFNPHTRTMYEYYRYTRIRHTSRSQARTGLQILLLQS